MALINYEVKDQIAFMTINRPEVRNAMDAESWQEFTQCLSRAEADETVRVVILTGAGEKAFMSGADIRTLHTRTPLYQMKYPYSLDALSQIEALSKPVIAAINGVAFGGGFETTLACDIRIAADHAKFGLPEPTLGILPGAGGTQRLARIVGLGQAKEVILAGRVYTAEEALRAGLVYKVVPREELLNAAVEVAQIIIKRAPLSIAISKKILNHSMDMDLSSGFLAEQLGFMTLLGTEDKLEGTAAFLEKRPPQFTGK